MREEARARGGIEVVEPRAQRVELADRRLARVDQHRGRARAVRVRELDHAADRQGLRRALERRGGVGVEALAKIAARDAEP